MNPDGTEEEWLLYCYWMAFRSSLRRWSSNVRAAVDWFIFDSPVARAWEWLRG